jgi:hypothetical protein
MEPRWFKEWAKSNYTYLGGTNAFDLWFDDKKDVRVVAGAAAVEWDWFYYEKPSKEYRWGTDDLRGVDHIEVLDEALTYLRLFAPWVEDAMKNGEQEYHIYRGEGS